MLNFFVGDMLPSGILKAVFFEEPVRCCTSEAKPMSRRTSGGRFEERYRNKIVYGGFVIFHYTCNKKLHALSKYSCLFDLIMLLQLILYAQLLRDKVITNLHEMLKISLNHSVLNYFAFCKVQ